MYYRKATDDCLKWPSRDDSLWKEPNPAGMKRRVSYRLPGERFSASWSGVREPRSGFKFPYLDPRFDWAFKHIFGKKAHKDLLIDFLDSLFEGRKRIRDVMLCPTEHIGEREEVKKVIYDLLCRGDHGEYFLIEMQRAHQSFFSRRALHYLARLVGEQVGAGSSGDSFHVGEVYLIAVLDFRLWDDPAVMSDPVRRYMREAGLSWIDTREPFADMELRFIQLPEFNKTREELGSRLDYWLYALKHLGRMRARPEFLDLPVFRKLFQVAKITNLDEEDKNMYKMVIDSDRDWRNAISYAENKAVERGMERGMKRGMERGMKQGIKQGIKQGMKQGMEQGVKRGEAQGKRDKELSVVRALIMETDFDDRKIAALAGVSESFVRSLRD